MGLLPTYTYMDMEGNIRTGPGPGIPTEKAPDTDPVMYGSRVLGTLPQAAVGGIKHALWDVVGLPLDIATLGAETTSLLNDSDNPYLRTIGQKADSVANWLQGGQDLWDEWGKQTDDYLYGDRKVDDQGNIYRDGYYADGSEPVAQKVFKGLGSIANIPLMPVQAVRGYDPFQPGADVWHTAPSDIRRAMYASTTGVTPTAEVSILDPVGSYRNVVAEASKDPRVAAMTLGNVAGDLASTGQALGGTAGLAKGLVKGGIAATKAAAKGGKAFVNDVKQGLNADYRNRDIWGDPMTHIMNGTSMVPRNIQAPVGGNLNTFKPVPRTTMSNARLRDYNMRGR